MTMNPTNYERNVRWALRIAGLFNVAGTLGATKAFTDDAYFQMAPTTYNRKSMLMAMLWGAAFWTCADTAARSPRILAVFAAEKLYYSAAGTHWLLTTSPRRRAELKTLSPQNFRMFHLNGPADGLWAVIFVALFTTGHRMRNETIATHHS
ncbi:MAG: hypothetical protein ABW137_07550 [Mycobacterium sp.]